MQFPSVAKFKVEFISREPSDDGRISELAGWCARFNESGLTPPREGTDRSLGNLSFRLEPGDPALVITASALSSKDELSPSDFVKVVGSDLERRVVSVSGVRDPSSESMMHYEIYKRRPDVNAIFHGHDKQILACGPELGLPQTAEEQPSGSLELLFQAMDILDRGDFLLLKNHGFLSLGKTMKEAGNLALRIKKSGDTILNSRVSRGLDLGTNRN